MNLNAVNIGHNKYCGPAVLSILTGKSTDECAQVISSINGKYTIEGVYLKDLLTAADRMGFDCEAIPTANTLYGTLVRLAARDGLYIVSVTGHFIAIEVADHHIYFCDNHTKEPMPAASSARLQQQCKAVHRVEKRRDPVLLSTEIVPDIGRDSDGKIVVRIIQYFVYDIEKWNKDILIVKFKLNDTNDFNRFIDSLNSQAEIL